MITMLTQRQNQSTSVLTAAALEMQKLNMHMKTPLSLMQVLLMHDKDAFTLTGTYWGRTKPEGKITFQYRDCKQRISPWWHLFQHFVSTVWWIPRNLEGSDLEYGTDQTMQSLNVSWIICLPSLQLQRAKIALVCHTFSSVVPIKFFSELHKPFIYINIKAPLSRMKHIKVQKQL